MPASIVAESWLMILLSFRKHSPDTYTGIKYNRLFGSGLIIWLSILLCTAGYAKPYIQYNEEIKACYRDIIHLKIRDSEKKIKELKVSQRENLAILHLENYIDFFHLFITENKADYQARLPQKDARLSVLQNVQLADAQLDFIKAEILLQWALIQIKFDEKLAAGQDVYSAYKLLEANQKKYPGFKENNKSLSILHVLAESVPKWVRKLIGVKGSIQQGRIEIEQLVEYAINDKSYFYRDEVAAIYTYILFYQFNDKEGALAQFNRFSLSHTDHPLIAFLKASIYQRAGKNDACLEVLNTLKSDAGQLPFYYLEFMKGRAYLNKQDVRAKNHLLTFVQKFNGQHFIKEAYQKLAWYELSMNNDHEGYKNYMANCLTRGKSLVDEDKQAEKEAKKGDTPVPFLLKSRLYYDGGYYNQALDVLLKNDKYPTQHANSRLEYYYRLGRVYQAQSNATKAIPCLKYVLTYGEAAHSYYAANAALQMGLMYETDQKWTSALHYFNKCLEIDSEEYKTSLHQKAKSGVQRVILKIK